MRRVRGPANARCGLREQFGPSIRKWDRVPRLTGSDGTRWPLNRLDQSRRSVVPTGSAGPGSHPTAHALAIMTPYFRRSLHDRTCLANPPALHVHLTRLIVDTNINSTPHGGGPKKPNHPVTDTLITIEKQGITIGCCFGEEKSFSFGQPKVSWGELRNSRASEYPIEERCRHRDPVARFTARALGVNHIWNVAPAAVAIPINDPPSVSTPLPPIEALNPPPFVRVT